MDVLHTSALVTCILSFLTNNIEEFAGAIDANKCS
jgi:hypothetical protein